MGEADTVVCYVVERLSDGTTRNAAGIELPVSEAVEGIRAGELRAQGCSLYQLPKFLEEERDGELGSE